jgi:hypothetical protein
MHKIKTMDVEEQQYTDTGSKYKKIKKEHEKIIKIGDSLFEIGFGKVLIEKNEDSYNFIGDYEELLAFNNKRPTKSFEWLD